MVLGPQAHLQLKKNEAETQKNAEGTTCERKVMELENRCQDLEDQLVKTHRQDREEVREDSVDLKLIQGTGNERYTEYADHEGKFELDDCDDRTKFTMIVSQTDPQLDDTVILDSSQAASSSSFSRHMAIPTQQLPTLNHLTNPKMSLTG